MLTPAVSTTMHTVQAGEASIPALGLGTWQNTGQQCTDSVTTALDVGYRHVDTAQAYRNERAVGDGIHASSVDREDPSRPAPGVRSTRSAEG